MIKALKLILLLGAQLIVTTAFGQHAKYDVRLVQTGYQYDPCLQEGKIFIDIEVKAAELSSQFFIADQNYRFKYDTTILSNPQIVEELKLSGLLYGPGYVANFAPHHITGSLGDVISYNVVMSGGTGYFISSKAFTKVGKLSFDLINTNSTQLKWLQESEFPPTFIAEKVGGQIGILYQAKGVKYLNPKVDSLSGNPVPKRRDQNLHICSGQTEKIFEYSVKNGTSYDFRIEPQHAGRFVSDSTGVNHVHIVYDQSIVDSVRIIAGKSYPCKFVPHLEWPVQFDHYGTMPGDVNLDGYIDWSSDATAQLYAKAQYYEYSKSFNQINSFYRPKDRFNLYYPFAYQHESYDYTCHYSEPWTADIGHLNFNLNGQLNNLKHADVNGDGILLTNTCTPNYQHTITDLDHIWGGPLDADIIVRNHYLKTAPHPGYAPGGTKGLLDIVPMDSIIIPGQELRLIVNLGKMNYPVHDVQSIGFIVEFTYGSYKNPILKLGNSSLGSSNQLYVSDYPVLNHKTNPFWYIALSREDLSGATFTGQELCRIICEVTIAGFGNGPKNKGQQGEVAINVHDVVVINSTGQMTTIDGSSVTIPTSNTPKNSMLRTAENPDFQLFPNPATHLLNVSFPTIETGEQAYVYVYNALGKKVKEQCLTGQNGSITLSVEDFPSGIYFVEYQEGAHSFSKRLVINSK